LAFHTGELARLPAKLAAWGAQIDATAYSGTSPGQVQALVENLGNVAARIAELLAVGSVRQDSYLARALEADRQHWLEAFESIVGSWSEDPSTDLYDRLGERLRHQTERLETRVAEVFDAAPSELSDAALGDMYRMLGRYRGVSVAVTAYAGSVRQIDWKGWTEERFS
jgi:hypothetical protein